MSCTTGAANAALVTRLNANVTTALRNLFLKLSRRFHTAFVPKYCFLFVTALGHDLGSYTA
jgi:hypothetical protein